MTPVAQKMLEEIQELAPQITPRAAEIELGRRMPLDLVSALRKIGVYQMYVPRSHGGPEVDMPTSLQIIAAIARIDGSVGWTAMVANTSALFLTLLPAQTYANIYKNGPDSISAGVGAPGGTAEAVAEGFRVSGRWGWASGCQHADWMFGICAVKEGGSPVIGPSGMPLMRGVVLPASRWQIEDTWQTAGLKGTGSNHITLKDEFVPAENFFDFPFGAPCVSGPLYQALHYNLPLMQGACTLGMAEGALDSLIALANSGRQQQRAPTTMSKSEIFQYELGGISADVMAARAVLEATANSLWEGVCAGRLQGEAPFIRVSQAVSWISATCVRVVDGCFALGGGAAVYDSSDIQRRMRDVHVAAQHTVAQKKNFLAAGRLLLDNPPSL